MWQIQSTVGMFWSFKETFNFLIFFNFLFLNGSNHKSRKGMCLKLSVYKHWMLRRILFWLLHGCRLPDRGHLHCSGQPPAFQSMNINFSFSMNRKTKKTICKPYNVLFSHCGCQWQIERTLRWCIWCIGHYCKKSYHIEPHNMCFISLEMNKSLNTVEAA